MLSKIPMNRFGEVDEVAEMVSLARLAALHLLDRATFDLSAAGQLLGRPTDGNSMI
jgi:hypothetical protein